MTNALRIPNAHAFDVTEACAGFARALEVGWTPGALVYTILLIMKDGMLKAPSRSDSILDLQIADLYLTDGRAQTVAIVSATSPPEDDLHLKSVADVELKLGSLTVSCCATATIVGRVG